MDSIDQLLNSDPYQNQSYGSSDGFPASTPTSPDQVQAVQSAPVKTPDSPGVWSRFSDLLSGTGDTLKQWDTDAGAWLQTTVKDDYASIKSGLGTVVGDIASPIKNMSDYFTTKFIIIVAVVAVGLYLVGKGGAVKANVIVPV